MTHLANAHIRLAWEANVAILAEVKRCGFDPSEAEPKRWITVDKLRKGLEEAERNPLGVLAEFAPNEAFLAYARSEALDSTRRLRDVPDQAMPTLDDRQQEVGRGLVETLRYAEALWAHTKRWLPTIGVLINPVPGAVEVTTKHQTGLQSQRFPRENRDPGPFLRTR